MFSQVFAERVISDAKLDAEAVVLDPWLGVGTTTAAAAALGFHALGVDINPVMVTIARGRSLPRAKASKVLVSVQRWKLKLAHKNLGAHDPLLDWFGASAATALRGWEETIRTRYPEGEMPQEAGLLLTSLFETARTLAADCRSKNPTWVKQPAHQYRSEVSTTHVNELVLSAIRQKVELCPASAPAYKPKAWVGTCTKLELRDASVDLVLTSPPYCTRIDYAVTTRIELAVLGRAIHDVRNLRDQTMGTSTIRAFIAEPRPQWGTKCLAFLDAVLKHASKASQSYYYKTYIQYFDDLYQSLNEINRCTRPAGHIVVVVQDSHYKEIHTDLPAIVIEMGQAGGWRLTRCERYPISRTMRLVNTRSRAYRDDVPCSEGVLWFVREKQ